MRRGREFYSDNYERVMELHNKGLSTGDIAKNLGISYSCAYHWVKGLRKPSSGRLNEFEEFIKKNGPVSVMDIKEFFPKHNELFLTSVRRGIAIQRRRLSRKFGDYATWYYMEGQEDKINERIKELIDKYKELKEKLIEMIDFKVR